ncbi:alpha-amylase family glycosyl hydrolase [Colwellia echini]|uniref:Alpha-amylase n=1 Tax=Colwellia echini TaxID=1982103 RepID=A0ABY3MYL4_9GAMM|nr:alpha-amylase family glycosyl hydrolase [Colwellia echini]TYK66295.1 alpha-amylase [Colwellia echini]
MNIYTMLLNKTRLIALALITTAPLLGCEQQNTEVEITTLIQKNNDSLSSQNTAVNNLEEGELHVPSPQWQDQIIYLLMIDRFNDGNKENSDQGAGVYELGAKDKYNGGDLQGVIDKLDYIQQLGATAVWTTPQVANQWWDPIAEFWGYHGYWARDFTRVDEHYGDLEDYQRLARKLHSKNMYLIQDVVVNHTGNFFYYDGDYDENNVTKNFKENIGSLPSIKASQFPLNLSDVNNPEHKLSNVFNWTPTIQDVTSEIQETTYQTSGLDDMNTRNPLVRELLKDSFGNWIKNAGVDAFRVDTAKYVEKEFYEDFLHSENGILNTAKSTGRDNFLTFGEVFETSLPNSDSAEQKIAKYLGTAENPRLAAPIGFPIYSDMKQVFAGGRPTSYLAYRVAAAMKWYKDPYTAVNFIDNHDVERFLANGTMSGLKQAYAFMMSIPGIPTIYQGDEQAHKSSRQAMFAGGYGSEQDQFNQQSEMYRFIQKLTKLRSQDKVFSRGSIEFFQVNESTPGILAYKREYRGKEAYVIFNTADETALLSRLPTSFSRSNEPSILLAENVADTLFIASDGNLTMLMPARSILIFSGQSHTASQEKDQTHLISQSIKVNPIPNEFTDVKSADISGTVTQANADLLRIIDGNIEHATKFFADSKGNWTTELPLDGLGRHQHSIEIYWPEQQYVSEKFTYWMTSTLVSASAYSKDDLGDDKGISGTYTKPEYQIDNCYLDIESAQVKAGGSILELRLTMCDTSNTWAPPNQFDHLALTIYFDNAKKSGNSALPLVNTNMPNNAEWDLVHSTFGWGNYVFGTEQATAAQEGIMLNYTPKIEVNHEADEIKITYEGKRLGITDWSNSAIYITTWDKDEGGDYRELKSAPSKWHFSNENTDSPRIADDVFIILKAL